MLSNKLNKVTKEIRRDMEGRWIILRIEVNGDSYTICNVYGPNSDNPKFYHDLRQELIQIQSDYIVLAGDFNVALDPRLDRHQPNSVNPQAIEQVHQLLTSCDLIDTWRSQNADKRCFSWKRTKPKFIWARLYYICISQSLTPKLLTSEMTPGLHSDHSMVQTTLQVGNKRRGPGYWKLNTSLLNDNSFKEEAEKIIQGAPRLASGLDAFQRWELVKQEFSRYAKEYSKCRANSEKTYLQNLHKLLHIQEMRCIEDPNNEAALKNINEIYAELDAINVSKAKSAAFRAKANWIEYGDKCSSYFLSLEKRNRSRKTMSVCRVGENLTEDSSVILEEQAKFYRKLYTKNPRTNFNLKNETGTLLDAENKQRLDAPISEPELYDACMTLKTGKTPGCDGLPIEFYQTFWRSIVHVLAPALQMAVDQGQLNPSARRGIISLIPKSGKDETLIKNWRPLTLLNYDYKIYAKAISNRLEEVTPQLIGRQQTGFIKGRTISTNIRKTIEIITYAKEKRLGLCVAQVDFSKCFDRCDFTAIKRTMRYFGFGEPFIAMIMVLFNQFLLCNQNNGYFSDFYYKTQGVGQGCPASPGIYYIVEKLWPIC